LVFWGYCEDELAHSVQGSTTFGPFDAVCALTFVISCIVMLVAGIRSLGCRSRAFFILFVVAAVLLHIVLVVGFGGWLHHYHMGFVIACCCTFASPLSRIMFVKCVAIMIEGIAFWGADPLLGDADQDSREDDGWTVSRVLSSVLCIATVACVIVIQCTRCRRTLDTE